MKQFKCLVVDDEAISRKFLQHYIEQIDKLILIGSFADAAGALTAAQADNVDIIFLDIEMPEKSGLQFLDELQASPAIILVTAREKYAVKAFEYEVVDYLVKPITFSRFGRAVEKACRYVLQKEENQDSGEIFFKTSSKLVKLKFQEIMFIEARGDYVRIHTAERKLLTYTSMSEIIKKLPPNQFVRVHRSYIVNLNCISNIQEKKIAIADSEIPLGASYKKAFFAKIPR